MKTQDNQAQIIITNSHIKNKILSSSKNPKTEKGKKRKSNQRRQTYMQHENLENTKK